MFSQDNSNWRALALRYRPQSFSDLIGQEALVQVLTNSLVYNRVPHAILLSGTRGVGKTTAARIIACALNCHGPDGKNRLPTPSPCGRCESCRSVAEDRHLDVIELDAASNTSVDNVRNIIETVGYMALSARYKVYIIDEVHMLTKQAFNALLKTLESPPPHIKFILATTEIDRIPDTIISRCMRFDLKRINFHTTRALLRRISEQEGVKVESEALDLLAHASDGSARDALFLLEKAILMSQGYIHSPMVQKMLGLMDRTRLPFLYSSLIQGDIGKALEVFQDQYSSGVEPLAFLHDLLNYTYTLTLNKLRNCTSDNDYSSEADTSTIELARKIPISLLIIFWKTVLEGIRDIQLAPLDNQTVEMTLVRLANMNEKLRGNIVTTELK